MPVTSKELKTLIDNHKATKVISYQRYQRYYEGNNTTIQDKDPKADPDNRKSMPYARNIVNTVVGFEFPVDAITWNYPDDNATIDYLNSEEYRIKETNAATIALTKGLAYKLIWQEDNKLHIAVVPPEKMIIIWNDDIEPKKEAAIYFTEKNKVLPDGGTQVIITAREYTAQTETKWISIDNGAFVVAEGYPKKNPAGRVNVAEHYVNPEKRNIFYHVMDLIDLQDELISSNMANEIQTIANAILTMSGYLGDELPDENGRTHKDKFLSGELKVMEGFDKAGGDLVEWVVKTVQFEFIFGIYDRMDKKIPQHAEIIDWSDDSLYSDLSGEAMKYRLIPFENKCAMIEAYYKQGQYEQIEIMNAFPVTERVNIDDIKIEYRRNLPLDRTTRIKEAIDLFTMFGKELAMESLGEDIIPNMEEKLEEIRQELAEALEREAIDNTQVNPEPQAEEDD